MGELELIEDEKVIKITAEIVLYGDEASKELTAQFVDEVQSMWNEPEGIVEYNEDHYNLVFEIRGVFRPNLTALEVISNTNPRMNYFRVEDYSPINISWVDGINSNTGYMLIDNLYEGSTTAAHEFGHTIGLAHPDNLNLIGKGVPGIMYPRGTLVDREYQYDFNAAPATNGGTIHPMNRRVLQEDIDLLNIPNLLKKGQKYIGGFSSVYHSKIIKKENV